MSKRRKPTKPRAAPPPQPRRTGMLADADDMKPRIGRPRFQPTEKDREFVRRMAAVGLSHEDIATTVKVDRNTLVKYFRSDIDEGRIEANALVAASLFKKATDKATTGASVRAAEIWLRARAGWVDAVHPKDPTDDAGDKEIAITGGLPDLPLDEDPIPVPTPPPPS